ncbi:hypothetical protein D3C80_1961020 [compost metagenome]
MQRREKYSLAWDVRTNILVGRCEALMRVMTSRPSIRGMAMSRMTMSGSHSRARRTASTPLSVSATTSKRSCSSSILTLARMKGWSSTIIALYI